MVTTVRDTVAGHNIDRWLSRDLEIGFSANLFYLGSNHLGVFLFKYMLVVFKKIKGTLVMFWIATVFTIHTFTTTMKPKESNLLFTLFATILTLGAHLLLCRLSTPSSEQTNRNFGYTLPIR